MPKGLMRHAKAVFFAIAAVAITLGVSAAQPPAGPRPIDNPFPIARPFPHPTMIARPTPTPTASPAATPSPAFKLPIRGSHGSPTPHPSPSLKPGARIAPEDDVLGARVPLRGPALPKMTAANTVYLSPGQSFDTRPGHGSRVHPMSVSGSITVTPSSSGSCTGTVGTIYNLNCQVNWQVINIDPNHSGYLHQDYFVDASGANVDTQQTVGSSYDPYTCSGSISYTGYCGSSHSQTLSDAGVYVLASAVCTNYNSGGGSACSGVAYWETVEYIVVTSSSTSLKTYEDSGQSIESTNFFIPSSGSSTVYLLVSGLTINDKYVVYMEFTSYMGGVNPCSYMIYSGASGTPTGTQMKNGLCDPNSVTGFQANQLTSSLTWTVTNSYSPGTYSIVVFDQTAQKRVVQRQVSLDPLTGSGNGQIAITPVAGSVSSPTPAPQTTSSPLVSPAPPMQRFAFDTPSEASDSGINLSLSSLNSYSEYIININDPNGYTAPFNMIDTYSNGSGAIGISETFDATTEPQNFGPNTYTVSAVQVGTTNTAAATGFQIVGYNALTQFTNQAGTSIIGTALTIAKNSTAPGGLQFLNDGDSVYGTANGDALRGIFFTTNGSGISIILPCTPCTSEVVTDSAGNSWNVNLTTSNGNGTNANTDLLITPVSSSTTLANAASITLANLTFKNTAGNSGCASGCEGYTQILPVDGRAWSGFNSNPASNPVYFTNSAGNTWAATSYITHLGTVTSGSAYTGSATTCVSAPGSGCEVHGYEPGLVQSQTVSGIPFETQGIYALNEPYSASTGTSDTFQLVVTNNSSQGGGGSTVTFTGIEVAFPTDYFQSGASITLSVDNNSPTKWTKVTSGTGVPSNCSQTNILCMEPTSPNTGIPGGGQSQTIWIDAAGLPKASFPYEEFTVESFLPATVNASAQVTGFTVPVGSTNPYTVDGLAFAAYSLDSSLMSAYTSPSSVGTSTNYPVTFYINNAATAQDPNPDYLDAIVIDDPGNYLSGGGLTTPVPSPAPSPSGWSLLASKADGSGGTLYWFGVCAGNYNWSDGPPTSGQPPVNASLPKCGTAASEYNSIVPGGQFSLQANVAAPATSGTLTFKMWAHGANGDGWSSAKSIPVNVTPISATAGFTGVGGYPTASTLTRPNEPSVSGDSNTTYGNAFTYTIYNSSSTGPSNNITQATITIPYQTDTGGTGVDSSGVYWTLEPSTPSITVNLINASGSSSPSGCTVAQQSASASGNGYIKLSGCTLPPGDTWQIQFYMKMPYLPNTEFQFPASLNSGAITASENWQGDTYMKILLGASIVVTVRPSPDPSGGGNPSPFCAQCTYDTTSTPEKIDFGTVAAGSSVSGTDVVMVQVYTDAANPYGGWNLYESIDSNPSQTGTPTNEFLASVDSPHSTAGAGLTYSNTAGFAVLPTTTTSFLMATAPSTNTARRNPFDIVGNYQITINAGGGGSTAPQVRTVTFTFIPQ